MSACAAIRVSWVRLPACGLTRIRRGSSPWISHPESHSSPCEKTFTKETVLEFAKNASCSAPHRGKFLDEFNTWALISYEWFEYNVATGLLVPMTDDQVRQARRELAPLSPSGERGRGLTAVGQQ